MACDDYTNLTEALDPNTMAIRDAILCNFQDQMGGPVFAAFIFLGMVNVPIYIRTNSIIIPFVITMSVGGLVLTAVSSIATTLIIVVLLLLFGIVPVLALKRVQR